AELLAPSVELFAEQRGGQRRVDEPGCDQVDPNGRELERDALRQGGKRRAQGVRELETRVRPAAAGAADEEQASSRANPARGVASDVHRQPEMLGDVTAALIEVELRQRRVIRPGPRDQHVVDRTRKLVEEPSEPVEVERVEG